MKLPIDLLERAGVEFPHGASRVRDIRARLAAEGPLALDGLAVVERRKRMIAAVAVENVADAFERYIGENDLLPINYLLLGYLQSRAVGLIRYFDRREGREAVATGFLVSEHLLMTNHHVFPVQDHSGFDAFARDAVVEFNYEHDIDGNRSPTVQFSLAPGRFLYTSAALDMALIAVDTTDRTGSHELKAQGYLVLNGTLGKAGLGDFASLIQHPGGREKQIAIRKNEIINLDLPDVINYVSDTAQGSSGAPVFNDQWQVIALHSAGNAKKNGEGQYLDKAGEVIVPVDGRIDEERIVWESNRGIRVSAMRAHLAQAPGVATDPLIQALFAPAYTDSRPYAFLSRPLLDADAGAAMAGASLAAVPPAPAPAAVAPITISISISPSGHTVVVPGAGAVAPLPAAADFEKRFEDALDFSACAGFDEHFLGVHLPMPTPGARLRKKLAFLTGSPAAYTLRYHHFSILHHAVRRVPIVSGVNVHGKYRYAALDAEGSRVDRWFRDNRIDYDVQLDDEFYARSGFDRGHLARREDAEWGTSAAKAKLAADLTCSYANAVPQVPALNRARFGYHGRWGQLEEELLEKGIENEEGKAARICVFNGPLFDADDPVFKGVQVALRFYKIVVWYERRTLRTTCFQLSQEKLVGQIDFEVLRFDEVFRTHQVPIAKIEKATGLKFPDLLADTDTSDGRDTPVE